MYYYGGYPNTGYSNNSCGCSGGNIGYIYPNYGCCGNSNYAIIIVLFILLVIIIGTRWGR